MRHCFRSHGLTSFFKAGPRCCGPRCCPVSPVPRLCRPKDAMSSAPSLPEAGCRSGRLFSPRLPVHFHRQRDFPLFAFEGGVEAFLREALSQGSRRPLARAVGAPYLCVGPVPVLGCFAQGQQNLLVQIRWPAVLPFLTGFCRKARSSEVSVTRYLRGCLISPWHNNTIC